MYQQIKTWTKSGLGFTENLILVTLGLILSKFFLSFSSKQNSAHAQRI